MFGRFGRFVWMWVLTAALVAMQGCASGPLPIADGYVMTLAESTTVPGVMSVLNGAQPLGEVWVKGAHSVVAWPQSGGWAWACLRFNCQDWMGYFKYTAQGQGNVANWRTWSDLTAFMRSDGWTKLPSAALPTAVTAGQSVSGFLNQMAGSLTGFLVVPVMAVPTNAEVQG